jgi:hypothetical protein
MLDATSSNAATVSSSLAPRSVNINFPTIPEEDRITAEMISERLPPGHQLVWSGKTWYVKNPLNKLYKSFIDVDGTQFDLAPFPSEMAQTTEYTAEELGDDFKTASDRLLTILGDKKNHQKYYDELMLVPAIAGAVAETDRKMLNKITKSLMGQAARDASVSTEEDRQKYVARRINAAIAKFERKKR